MQPVSKFYLYYHMSRLGIRISVIVIWEINTVNRSQDILRYIVKFWGYGVLI